MRTEKGQRVGGKKGETDRGRETEREEKDWRRRG